MNMNVPAERPDLPSLIAEYHARRDGGEITSIAFDGTVDVITTYDGVDAELAAFDKACSKMVVACTLGISHTGSNFWGREGRPKPEADRVKLGLLQSVWRTIYTGLQIDKIAPVGDKTKFETMLAHPPELSLENIRIQFGDYIMDPRQHILRGLAEQFSDLDPAFRSHEKMKIGVAGLPKRIILSSFGDYYSGHGAKQLQDVIRAINTFMDRPQIEWQEFNRWCCFHAGLREFGPTYYSANEMVQHSGTTLIAKRYIKAGDFNADDWNVWTDPLPDLEVRIFKNGNAHIHFAKPLMNAVNLALAEYYGEVLPDCPDAKSSSTERRASTELSKDLQFYPTPDKVATRLCSKSEFPAGEDGICRVLEPSCGEGAIMSAVQRYVANTNNDYYCPTEQRRKQPQVIVQGIECDAGRAATARSNGFTVQTANFLQVKPEPIFDVVLMNPPFYGKHYQLHIEHAVKFLKPSGVLYAVLPESAAGAHGYVERPEWGRDAWEDLPVGSFASSGTNINTGIAKFTAPK
jgi:hypothetical protein